MVGLQQNQLLLLFLKRKLNSASINDPDDYFYPTSKDLCSRLLDFISNFEILKKPILILVLIVYMLSTFGISINKDYCCGKLRATSFFFHQQNNKACKKSFDNGCCKTESVYYQLTDSHFKSISTSIIFYRADIHKFSDFTFQDYFFETQNRLVQVITDPPDIYSRNIFLLCCNFRI